MHIHSERSCLVYSWQMDSSYFSSKCTFILSHRLMCSKNWVSYGWVYPFPLRWDMKESVGNNSAFHPQRHVWILTKVSILSWGYWYSFRDLQCSNDTESLSALVKHGTGSLIVFAGLHDLIGWTVYPMVMGSLLFSVCHLSQAHSCFINMLGPMMASIIDLLENLDKMSDRITSLKLSSIYIKGHITKLVLLWSRLW